MFSTKCLISPDMIKREIDRACNLSSSVIHRQFDAINDEWRYRYEPRDRSAHVYFKVPAEDLALSLDAFYAEHVAPVCSEVFGLLLEKQ